MQIQVNTDRHIEGGQRLTAHVQSVVENALDRFGDLITRVEVHLSDQNGDKTGPDEKRCVMEARIRGRKPAAATEDADTIDQAIDGAVTKLQHLLTSDIGRLRARERTQPAERPDLESFEVDDDSELDE